jgi:hypothetical protein
MPRAILVWLLCYLFPLGTIAAADDSSIPRPEHPRPDAMRSAWASLNGRWEFRFDATDQGTNDGWEKPGAVGFDRSIVVPFPWESELSGIHEKSGKVKIGWYRRRFSIPKNFSSGDRVWLRFDAVDWRADVWVNGTKVAGHDGGYTPFEADISGAIKRDGENLLVVRAFDPTDPELPTGKQIGWYTPSSGIWQTVWLEARPKTYITGFKIVTTTEPPLAQFVVDVAGFEKAKYRLAVLGQEIDVERATTNFEPAESATGKTAPDRSTYRATVAAPVRNPELWTPETPRIYEVTLELADASGKVIDSIQTYFGLRTIKRGVYGDQPFERILLNGKPVFIRAALDQSFNPKGIYTAPTDEFLKHDMIIAKTMGLNALRIHIKPDEPRRLYWADRLGVMIMEDMPNTWRQTARARLAWEGTMREAVARDRNHPSIIAWVAFNETWGLGKPEDYKKDRDTQQWVSKMVDLIRQLDGGERLIEDNSPCNYDHITNTDINSWHFYIDNHDEARRHIEHVIAETKPGGEFNYCPGNAQASLPFINSEYGAVSAGGGDRDISWGLRDLTTQLRRHPKIQGFVYTELDDIEWEHNGLVNYDRSPKAFGYDAWLPDMRPNELLGADFIGYDTPPAIVGKPGEKVEVPIFVSHYSDRQGPVKVRWWVSGYDARADVISVVEPRSFPITWKPYDVVSLPPLKFTLPNQPWVGAVLITLRDEQNRRIAANFVNVVVQPDRPLPRIQRRDSKEVVIRFAPGEFARQKWSDPVSAPRGKVYGRGKGFFEYKIELPPSVVKAHPESVYFLFEAGAKANRERVDWPERQNRRDYPQTDPDRPWTSMLAVSVNGRVVVRIKLLDDAADSRGVRAHLAGIEHGSHGELVDGMFTLNDQDRAALAGGKPLLLRLAVPDDAPHAGGLCLFGATTGELPLDPTLSIHTRDPLPADLGVDRDSGVAIPAGP